MYCFTILGRPHFFITWKFLRSKEAENKRMAKAEMVPLKMNKPWKSLTVSGFTLFEVSLESKSVIELLNHTFSSISSLPSSLSFAISLDMSRAKAEPFGNTWRFQNEVKTIGLIHKHPNSPHMWRNLDISSHIYSLNIRRFLKTLYLETYTSRILT